VPALTDKGRATRERIVQAAAGLFCDYGVAAVSIERIRTVAGVSGSQVSRYFGTRLNLIRAVIDWHVDKIVQDHDQAVLALAGADPDHPGPVECRATGLSGRHGTRECGHEFSLCALAAELGERDEQLRAALAAGYRRWAECLSDDLCSTGRRGRRDSDQMALAVLGAHQGGSLLAHILDDPAALTASLNAALAAAGRPASPRSAPQPPPSR
jgi:AcrR family transcriptional regulator